MQRLMDVDGGWGVEADLERHDLPMFLEGLGVFGYLLVLVYLGVLGYL